MAARHTPIRRSPRRWNEVIPLRFLGITDSAGFEFPLVPKFSGAAFAQYEAAAANDRNWYVRTDVTYIGKRYDSIANFAWVPTQVRTNLRAGIRADRVGSHRVRQQPVR
ncbi:MAG: hypothetical protein R3E65_00370 [Steroidobacteraceae bacterium]